MREKSKKTTQTVIHFSEKIMESEVDAAADVEMSAEEEVGEMSDEMSEESGETSSAGSDGELSSEEEDDELDEGEKSNSGQQEEEQQQKLEYVFPRCPWCDAEMAGWNVLLEHVTRFDKSFKNETERFLK